MKVGDLIRDKEDGEIGLVISPPRNYSLDSWKKQSLGYVMVHWRDSSTTREMDLAALKYGWVEIISESR
tara:strand:- start:335 stop:541 length:207 start_codon:yes stop_codon:yes gene_type:complete